MALALFFGMLLFLLINKSLALSLLCLAL